MWRFMWIRMPMNPIAHGYMGKRRVIPGGLWVLIRGYDTIDSVTTTIFLLLSLAYALSMAYATYATRARVYLTTLTENDL